MKPKQLLHKPAALMGLIALGVFLYYWWSGQLYEYGCWWL